MKSTSCLAQVPFTNFFLERKVPELSVFCGSMAKPRFEAAGLGDSNT